MHAPELPARPTTVHWLWRCLQAAEGLGLPLVRKTEEEFAVNYEVRFSDGFPVLLANEVGGWAWMTKGACVGVKQGRCRATHIGGG